MASTKDRQRAMERARYERVQAKMQKKRREAKRKQRIALVSSIAAIAVIGGVVGAVLATSSPSSNKTTTASSTVSASASSSAAATSTAASNPLTYEADTNGKVVSGYPKPTYNASVGAKDYTVTLKTNRGDIVFTADGKDAPYTVYSFVYLAQKGYFNNSKCHRLVWSSGLFMLQCGDPTGTGEGGPGYSIPDENLASLGTAGSSGTVTYKAGTVAMANTGQAHTGGSQFFLVGKDSTLAPSYTPWGTITKGLDILQTIGAAGAEAADSSGNTAPKDATTIESVSIS
ncbi:MAG TPA: peptidylprolyl isomerase [Actinospica sp.]|nr:peptidylprolyl isomerase [Actinospica sp.]